MQQAVCHNATIGGNDLRRVASTIGDLNQQDKAGKERSKAYLGCPCLKSIRVLFGWWQSGVAVCVVAGGFGGANNLLDSILQEIAIHVFQSSVLKENASFFEGIKGSTLPESLSTLNVSHPF